MPDITKDFSHVFEKLLNKSGIEKVYKKFFLVLFFKNFIHIWQNNFFKI
jgi:hypothetical protein